MEQVGIGPFVFACARRGPYAGRNGPGEALKEG
jgi:hypothetical protein